MAKFIKAPVTEEEAPGLADRLAAWLSGLGIETGLTGGALIAAGIVLGLYGLARLAHALMRRALWHETEGEVIEAEPATGGGYNPVVVYRDRAGRNRRFLDEMVTAADPTGKRVRVRAIGGSPRIIPASAARGGGLSAALPSLLLAAIAISTGLTGRLAGIVALPWP